MPQGGGGECTLDLECQGGCKWGHKLKPKKSLKLEAKTKKIPGTKMKPRKSHAEFWSLTSTQKGLNDNNEEQPYFLNGRICLFIYHTIAINFPRSSSHSYILPKKMLARIFLPPPPPGLHNTLQMYCYCSTNKSRLQVDRLTVANGKNNVKCSSSYKSRMIFLWTYLNH